MFLYDDYFGRRAGTSIMGFKDADHYANMQKLFLSMEEDGSTAFHSLRRFSEGNGTPVLTAQQLFASMTIRPEEAGVVKSVYDRFSSNPPSSPDHGCQA